MRLAAAQFDIAWEDKDANWRAIGGLLKAAKLPSQSLVVLPELADTGFTMNSAAVAGGDSLGSARRTAKELGVNLAVGLAAVAGGSEANAKPVNTCSIVNPAGAVLGTYKKIHLFSLGREDAHYQPGASVTIVPVTDGHETWQVCPLICYDLRFPELFRLAALAGAELFVIGANWPASRAHHWRALAIARAIENQAYVVACNRTGNDPNLSYGGGSVIVAPDGEVLAEAQQDTAVIHADVQRSSLLRWRERFPALRDARRSLIGEVRIESAPIH